MFLLEKDPALSNFVYILTIIFVKYLIEVKYLIKHKREEGGDMGCRNHFSIFQMYIGLK